MSFDNDLICQMLHAIKEQLEHIQPSSGSVINPGYNTVIDAQICEAVFAENGSSCSPSQEKQTADYLFHMKTEGLIEIIVPIINPNKGFTNFEIIKITDKGEKKLKECQMQNG